ncbi:hypothetical protein FEM48_Zijuj01G0056300 [Ziziphus jujuba var. spinosa]|uniref:Fibronectin type III-like domain-containing protein n=1 Tax=Ziziphus jujuba var. spinosa TaxID=714518 RepID=A0A978VZF5_ZIZJJ|nr:hypothetical protein FEM48_Zijuj01G0056300 [Ziziphus jujuba var. spinosa]
MLLAKYATRYVMGLQGNATRDKLKVAACCKHYTAYDLENWNGVDRFHFNARMRLGMFDGESSSQPFSNLGLKDVCTPDHQQLTLKATHQGIVLFKNRGCTNVVCNDDELFKVAEAVAQLVDAIVLVMGLDQSIEAESRDRIGLVLAGDQEELVYRVSRASRGPTILVLMSGDPIDVSFAKKDKHIGAILWARYPGQVDGVAIADILFGNTNPGGKLPMTWYPESYLAKVPMTDMKMRANPKRGYPGRTYRFCKGPIVFPFGHGLGFTGFDSILVQAPSQLSLPISSSLINSAVLSITNALRPSLTNCNSLSLPLHIDVKNNETMDGTHTILLLSTPPAGKWSVDKQLVGFDKVHVPAGSVQRVMVDVDVCKHLSVVDWSGVRRIPFGEHQIHIGADGYLNFTSHSRIQY